MRPWRCIAVLAAAALPSAVAAQSAFDQRIAHWRISAGGASCIAFNRPAYELNASPFNALSVQLNKQGRWNFTVHFWPKTFTPDADIPLVFSFGGAKDVRALGKAADEIGDPVEHRRELPQRRSQCAQRRDGGPRRGRGGKALLRRHRRRRGFRGARGLREDPSLARIYRSASGHEGRFKRRVAPSPAICVIPRSCAVIAGTLRADSRPGHRPEAAEHPMQIAIVAIPSAPQGGGPAAMLARVVEFGQRVERWASPGCGPPIPSPAAVPRSIR